MHLRTDAISWRDVDADVVVLDERTWQYVHLNATASVLWRALAADGGASEEHLRALLVEQFPAAAATAADDVAAFLADLRTREYLRS